MSSVETTLPPEMEKLRRRLVRSHNNKVGLIVLILVIGLFYWIGSARPHEHRNDPFLHWLIVNSPLFLSLPALFGCFALIELRDRALSRIWGFICPHCGEPLYKAESIYGSANSVRQTGNCPKCGQRVF